MHEAIERLAVHRIAQGLGARQMLGEERAAENDIGTCIQQAHGDQAAGVEIAGAEWAPVVAETLTTLPGASALATALISISLEKAHGPPARRRRPSLGFQTDRRMCAHGGSVSMAARK